MFSTIRKKTLMFKSIRDGFHLYLANKKTDIDKKILNLDRGFINYCFLQVELIIYYIAIR